LFSLKTQTMLLGKAKAKASNNLRVSARSVFLLKEFGKTGETLELPPCCILEFPDAEPDITSGKYKRFIVHYTSDDGIYEGGTFRLEFNVNNVPDYPYKPPQVRLLNRIWHPNIDLEGKVCHNYLKN